MNVLNKQAFTHISLNDKNLFDKYNYSPIYGILENEGIMNIVDKVENSKIHPLKREKIKFIDLGSGDGRLPIIMVKEYNTLCGHGIEFSSARHNNALKNLKTCNNHHKKKIKFIHGDMLDPQKINFADYNMFYISSLCFPPHLLKGIKKRLLNECKNKTHIFTSKSILADETDSHNNDKDNIIRLNEVFPVKQSWTNNSNLLWYTIHKNEPSLSSQLKKNKTKKKIKYGIKNKKLVKLYPHKISKKLKSHHRNILWKTTRKNIPGKVFRGKIYSSKKQALNNIKKYKK